MGTVVRPPKLGGDPGGNVIAGNDVLGSEWNGDINAIVTQMNGSIDSVNIATDGVTEVELQKHASDNAQRAVSSNHIKADAVITEKILALNVTPPKLSNATVGGGLSTGGIGTDKLRIITHTVTTTTVVAGVPFLLAAIAAPIDTGANWAGGVTFVYTVGGVVAQASTTNNPTVGFPKADYDLIGCYTKNITSVDAGGGNRTIGSTMVYVFLHQDSV